MSETMKLQATQWTVMFPTGWSEPTHTEEPIDALMGFVFGRHDDARGRATEGPLAVVLIGRHVKSVPISWLRAK